MPLRSLVLGGGNALGAYLAGAYQALHAAGEPPDWIAGTSIGAITAALIAGNPPDRRLERLRAFWDAAALPLWLPWARGAQWTAALQTRLLGRPGLFHPQLPTLSGEPGRLGVYDTAPLRRRLLELIDFELLNAGPVRVSVLAVALETGAEMVFDTSRTRITVDHLLACSALIPDFSPVRIDGVWLVDGGLAANLPADLVLAARPQQDMVCYLVDPFPAAAALPETLPELSQRQSDLTFACQTERTLRAIQVQAQAWPAEGARVDVVRTSYAATGDETAMKSWDFSAQALAQRWAAGQRDMQAALDRFLAAPPSGPPFRMHAPDGAAETR